MRVVVFGTYDSRRHPRIGVIVDGLRQQGFVVEECNVPWGFDTEERVGLLTRPWTLARPLWRWITASMSLWRQARLLGRPDAVIVGYLGILDIHLARLIWRRTPLVLDQLTFAGDTARDRGVGHSSVVRVLDMLDHWAISVADRVLVDTPESLDLIPPRFRHRGLVVPVGASEKWFLPSVTHAHRPLRVVFFGLYTPLQGAPLIGSVIAQLADAPIEWTMVGSGQDRKATHDNSRGATNVTWMDWVDPEALPRLVASHHVCLGTFGTGPKSRRVVPNKVYQGAAAGCAIVTSNTPPQVRALGDGALYVTAGDEGALAETLGVLATNHDLVITAGVRARHRASTTFRPRVVVNPLVEWLRSTA